METHLKLLPSDADAANTVACASGVDVFVEIHSETTWLAAFPDT
jgi:hypothetical protein